MSFDPRSLQRLQELGRQLPQPIPSPEAKSSSTGKSQRPRHKVETEENPDALFRELMEASADGTVPEHLLARLKELERRREPKQANPLAQPVQSEQLPPLRQVGVAKARRLALNAPRSAPAAKRKASTWPLASCCSKMTRTSVESQSMSDPRCGEGPSRLDPGGH